MKNNANVYEQFQDALYQESPRGFYELEAMKYGIMARTGLNEPEALELAVKIVLLPMTRSQAMKIRDEAIHRIMDTEGCIYSIARAKLNRQRDAMSREVAQVSQEYGVTRAAAFYMLQGEQNGSQKKRTDEETGSAGNI